MAHDDQWTVWDPFLAADGLTAKQRIEKERAEAWANYLEGGIGEPFHFDYLTAAFKAWKALIASPSSPYFPARIGAGALRPHRPHRSRC